MEDIPSGSQGSGGLSQERTRNILIIGHMAAAERINRLREAMEELGMDVFLLTDLPNIRYLSNFSGSSAMALVTDKEAYLITDFRYRLQAARELRDFQYIEQKGRWDKFMGSFLGGLNFNILGFEDTCSYRFLKRLRRRIRPRKAKAAGGLVEKNRMSKDDKEIAVIQGLIDVAKRAFSTFMEKVRPEMTEIEAALELEILLRKAGSDPPPFPIIVASGRNGAMPHAKATENVIGKGTPVIVDFGSSGEGYATDITRTFCLGEAPADIAKVYRLVYDAQRSAIESVRPGIKASQVDHAARSVINAAGMGDKFGHGTGHGVGLGIHESPVLSPDSREVLRPGMLVTIEPGIYLEGLGGVRIEDMVLVTEGGCRVLTRGIPKPRKIAFACI